MGLRDENVGNLEQICAQRKARLLEIRNRKRKENAAKNGDEEGEAAAPLPTTKVLFRNYTPLTDSLSSSVLPSAAPGDVESLVQEQLEGARMGATHAPVIELESLAPRKVTYDLLRAIEPALERLERETDRACVELIRQRLAEQGDLAGAVLTA